MSNSGNSIHHDIVAWKDATKGVSEGQEGVIESQIRRAEVFCRLLDICGDNADAVVSELKSAGCDVPKARERDALRWIGRGGLKNPDENRENSPNDLKDLWRTPRHRDRSTADAFRAAVQRDQKRDILKAYKGTGDRAAAMGKARLDWFLEETVSGWLDDHDEKQQERYRENAALIKIVRDMIHNGSVGPEDLPEAILNEYRKAHKDQQEIRRQHELKAAQKGSSPGERQAAAERRIATEHADGIADLDPDAPPTLEGI